VVEGERATFNSPATKARTGEVLSYAWERSTDDGTTWLPIARATTDTYTTFILSRAESGTKYRCVVTNTYFTTSKIVASEPATVTVLRAITDIVPAAKNLTLKVNETRTLTAHCLPADAEQDKTLYLEIGYGHNLITVNRETGEIHALAAGKATVVTRAASNPDVFAISYITVTETDIPDPIPPVTDLFLPIKTISVFNKSAIGTWLSVLPSDTFNYDGFLITAVKPTPRSGTFTLDTQNNQGLNLRASEIPRGKYVLELKATSSGTEVGSSFSVTVNVYDQWPAAKVTMPRLNTFYRYVEGKIQVTGTDLPVVEKIQLIDSTNPKDEK
jgi:hypothetical protein